MLSIDYVIGKGRPNWKNIAQQMRVTFDIEQSGLRSFECHEFNQYVHIAVAGEPVSLGRFVTVFPLTQYDDLDDLMSEL